MTSSVKPVGFTRVLERPLARVVAYYVLLIAGTALLVQLVPGVEPLVLGFAQAAPEQTIDFSAPVSAPPMPTGGTGLFAGPMGLALSAIFVMASACLLMLPVAWVYIETRQKKGFRQSLVQTLIILPLVVAGVVILVKNSLALAFSLGGIVAAVSFRNTLRDTKDAVYIFLSTGVGLAAGIQAVGVAAALSIAFNGVILLLWHTDFGRAPGSLSGRPAQLRLRRARALPNRTNAFVSMVDKEILRSLSPEQLDALADRAWRRRHRAAEQLGVAAPDGPTPMRTVRIAIRGDIEPARRAAEAALSEAVKRWEFVKVEPREGGGHTLEYRAKLKKRVSADQLEHDLRAAMAPNAAMVEIR